MRNPILITGAAGFIGANLVRYFVSKGIKINILIKKTSNTWRLRDILNKIEIPTNIDSNILDTHVVTSRQALTITSYDIYGDIFSWWIIYLLNKDVIGNSFFAEGGQQLTFILPSKRGLLYQQMTDATIFNNKHF